MADFTWNPYNWTVDTVRIKERIIKHYVQALSKAEDKLIHLMRSMIESIDHESGGGHGAPEWEEAVKASVHKVYRDIATNYIESGVGIEYHEGEAITAAASIYEFGVGDRAKPKAPPVQTHPGEMVWKDDLRRDISEALSSYYIPQFNQEGSFWIENAMKLMAKHFDDVLSEASDTLPDSVFYMNFKTVR